MAQCQLVVLALWELAWGGGGWEPGLRLFFSLLLCGKKGILPAQSLPGPGSLLWPDSGWGSVTTSF